MDVNAMPFNAAVQRKKTKWIERDSNPGLTDASPVVNHFAHGDLDVRKLINLIQFNMDPPRSGISHPFSVVQRFFLKRPLNISWGRRANLCLALKEGLYS
jgi:hypothetical protein